MFARLVWWGPGFWFLAAPAWAADETGGVVNGGVVNTDTPALPMADSYSFLKSLAALTFVLGLIFLCAYLFKRFTGIKTSGPRGSRVAIHLVGNLPLGDKRFLSVVEIQDKHYFVGVTQQSINMLAELDLDMGSGPDSAGSEGDGEKGGSFESILKRARSLLPQGHPLNK